MASNLSAIIPTVAAFLVLTGCRDSSVKVYPVAKETSPPHSATAAAKPASNMPAGMPASSRPAATQAAAALNWTVPAEWQTVTTRNMCVANFSAKGGNVSASADIAITTFPGDVGGDLANINRWRGQIQLPPITSDALPSAFETINAPVGNLLLADILSEALLIDGKSKARVLGVILKQPAHTWFIKISGEESAVAAQRPALLAFLNSLAFSDAPTASVESPAAPASSPALPPGHPPIGGAGASSRPAPPLPAGADSSRLPPGHPPIGGTTPAPKSP